MNYDVHSIASLFSILVHFAIVAARNDDDSGNKRVKVANPGIQGAREVSAQISDLSDNETAVEPGVKTSVRALPNGINHEMQQPQEAPIHIKEDSPLRLFISEHSQSFKCSTDSFLSWLQGMDITTLNDLHEACADADFVDSSMIGEGGLKKFKRGPFVRAVQAAAVTAAAAASLSPITNAPAAV